MPVQADLTTDLDLLTVISKRVRKQMYLVHRLDRPASGLVIIARNKVVASELSRLLQLKKIQKKYLVATANALPTPGSTLTHYLKRDGKKKKSLVSKTPQEGYVKAQLNYKHLKDSDKYSIYELELETGRFHQIRAQLAEAGSPIKGDVKYGARRKNKDRAIHLHAHFIEFIHPVTGEVLTVKSNPPEDPIWNLLD